MEGIELDDDIVNANILVVDDQAPNVKLLERLLQIEGYQRVRSTTDSREVEDLYKSDPFDLILLDIRMPHMTGHDVMKRLAEITDEAGVSVLVLTAQTDDETRIEALKNGANDFLTKPFDRTEVLLRVRNMVKAQLLHKNAVSSNEILSHRILERNAELEDTVKEMVYRLGRAAEFRDNETGLHVIRVSEFSRLLAETLDMPEPYCELIQLAAPMHDIGKIGTPDGILLKPGGLDEHEWKTMQDHAKTGGEILSESRYPLLQMGEIIAREHHEKWDGSGYPDGLSGEHISLAARIVAVADVYDALTSKRPYKEAWTTEAATEEIISLKGKHFDPAVVDAFVEVQQKFVDIKTKYAEPEDRSDNIADAIVRR